MKQWIFAWRALVRRPGFFAAVVVLLGAGIGATTAMFSLVDAVLLKPLPYPNPDRLVTVMEASPAKNEKISLIAPVRLEEWNRINRTFEAIAGIYWDSVTDTSGAEPERLAARIVTPRYFAVFGTKPELGRTFTPDEEVAGGPLAAIISHGFWTRRYHRSPAAIGQRLVVGGKGLTIVGVMPRHFTGSAVDLWRPAQFGQALQFRDGRFLSGVGRLQAGVTIAQAQEDLARVQRQLGEQFPQTDKNWSAMVGGLKEARIGNYRQALLLIFGAVSLLLLIAVANTAGLMLTQLHRRERELAIRSSIGGTRVQVAAGVMREVALIAAGGVGLGSLIAVWLVAFLSSVFSTLPRSAELQLDWRAMAVAASAGVLATLLCGLLPALQATRADVAALLAHGGRGGSAARQTWQSGLVAGQIAIAVVLLAGAGLMLRSYYNLSHVELGFNPADAVTFHVGAAWDEDRTRVGQMQEKLLAELKQFPGVESAGFANFLPTMGATLRYQVTLEGLARTDETGRITVGERSISRGYLGALGAPILSGQDCPDLRAVATSDPKALVSRRFVESYGKGRNLIGRHFRGLEDPKGPPTEIIGVVGDMREDTLNVTAAPYAYVCMWAGGWPDPEYVVRSQGDPRALARAIPRIAHNVDSTRAVFGVQPLEGVLEEALEQPRLNTRMLALFALSAMLLAAIGLYSVASLAVASRRREIGVRMALGAGAMQIVNHVLASLMRLIAIGTGAGLALTLVANRILRSLLFGVSPMDAATLGCVILTLAVVSLAATLIPARRAARVDPLEAIRAE
ncbi:MAG TPA: ABC transporter permease [Bryobacteraceae bacterium]|nr:ABC transporter permease [Bryobacteraceae bacterium]